jgi:ABC-type glycerol-3-phosphate transport system substrate-binding protein
MPALAEVKDDPAVVEASKSEAGILVYSNLEPEFWEPVLKLFNEKYPWIKVEATNMGGDLWEKYYAESATKTRTADLILTGGADRWLEFIDKGEAVPYVSPHTADLPEWSRPFPGALQRLHRSDHHCLQQIRGAGRKGAEICGRCRRTGARSQRQDLDL